MTKYTPEDMVHQKGGQWLQSIVNEVTTEAIKSAILYGVELAQELEDQVEETSPVCTCLTPITYATLVRGYCSGCSQTITIKVGTDGL